MRPLTANPISAGSTLQNEVSPSDNIDWFIIQTTQDGTLSVTVVIQVLTINLGIYDQLSQTSFLRLQSENEIYMNNCAPFQF